MKDIKTRLAQGGYWETAQAPNDSDALTGLLLQDPPFEPYAVTQVVSRFAGGMHSDETYFKTIIYLKRWRPFVSTSRKLEEKVAEVQE